jgi:hypothetical protein
MKRRLVSVAFTSFVLAPAIDVRRLFDGLALGAAILARPCRDVNLLFDPVVIDCSYLVVPWCSRFSWSAPDMVGCREITILSRDSPQPKFVL